MNVRMHSATAEALGRSPAELPQEAFLTVLKVD